MLPYQIEFTEIAAEMLTEISDARIRKKLLERIEKLKQEPEKQGKPLVDFLAGFRSVRAIGQQDRIVYKLMLKDRLVQIIGIGIRKEHDRNDIYAFLAKTLQKIK